ncbi:MAG: NADH-quinone oxidoreductase subunit N [Candidatus Rokubacteria bacterium]|nr:NADH-quinone oxidoreductase subunit N [Candidatus Rokubacteria bacterium]
MSPFTLEIGLAVLILVVFVANLGAGGADRRWTGWVSAYGLLALTGAALWLSPAPPALGGAFVQDGLALFAKRLFLVASVIGVVGGLRLPGPVFARRAAEYHLLLLASLLGMLVLASARDLILLFVAFELMSIPLYVLAGFAKREATAVEAALKFFLVGSVSSAVMAYGLSFVYGAARTTSLPGVVQALPGGDPLLLLGIVATFAGCGFKIAAFPFHMWVPDAYEAAPTPFVAWLSVAPKAAGFVALFRVYFEGAGAGAATWGPLAAGLATLTIVAGNLMALPQQNAKRLLAYSGIAHIGYMLVGIAAASSAGTAMVLFYLVAYVFGNMGAFLVVEAVARAQGSAHLSAFRGLAQRSPLLARAMLLFLLSLGGIPFVAGFWAKLYVFWAAAQQGLYWLVLVGAVLTVVALFYYLVVARRMYIEPPEHAGPLDLAPTLRLAVILCALGVVLLGVYPKPLVMAALRVAAPLFDRRGAAVGRLPSEESILNAQPDR